MSDNTPNDSVSLNTVFNIANIIKVIGVSVLSFFIVWLNTNYVSTEKYHHLEERVTSLEQKIVTSEKQLDSVMNMLKNIDLRLSNLITPNGSVIYTDKILKMDSDIEIIKRDISYIKDHFNNIKR